MSSALWMAAGVAHQSEHNPPEGGFPITLRPAAETAASLLWLRQHPVRAARLRGAPRIEPVDGLHASSLRLQAPLVVDLSRSFPVDYLEADGSGALTVQSREQALARADDLSRARLRITPPSRLRRLELAPDEKGATLSEARFFQGEEAPAPQVDVPFSGATAGAEAPQGGVGVRAVLLDVTFRGAPPPGVRVRLTHSAEPERAWFQADLRPVGENGARRLVAVLDPPDLWCEAGERISLSLLPLGADGAPAPENAAWLAGTPRGGLVTGSAEEVRDEFVLSRLNWLAAWYRVHAARAPWERPDWPPADAPAMRWLAALQRWQPRHPGVLAYASLLHRLPRETRVTATGPENAPTWAILAHQLLKRTQDLSYWWGSARQQPDGLYGGDPALDILLLQTLSVVPLITGDPVQLHAMRLGTETAWQAAGAAAAQGDLTRWASAASALPLQMLLRPEDPLPLERCILAARQAEAFTAVNASGHRHFARSATPDRPENALALAPALAAAWYSAHPAARRLAAEYATAWAEDMRAANAETTTVPQGITPESCRPAAGGEGPSASGKAALLRLLLDAAAIGGNARLLHPVTQAVALGAADPLNASLWRARGEKEYDDLLVRGARDDADLRAYAAWQATGNKQFLVDGLRNAIGRMYTERYLLSEAHPAPETVEIPGHLLLRSLYLGGPGAWRGGMPRLAVTWQGAGAEFAALVAESRRDRLKVLAYSFRPQERPAVLRLWGLRAGTYTLVTGPDDNYDDLPDSATDRRQVSVEWGTALPITLPARRTFVIMLNAASLRPEGLLPDVALCAEEVTLSPDRRVLSLVLHNIGAAPAKGVRVVVTDEKGKTVGFADAGELPWSEDLAPATRPVRIPLARPAPPRFRVTASMAAPEIQRGNNSVAVSR